jgi:hypothetical protein
MTQSTSRRSGEWRKSTTRSEQVSIEPAIMASEIERLPDLEGFLKFASIPDWHRVELMPMSGPSRARSKAAPTAETRSSAANTTAPVDTPTQRASDVPTVADMPPAAVAQPITPTPTAAAAHPASPSPTVAPTPHTTTRRVSKPSRKRTRKPRPSIAHVDPPPGREQSAEPHANP